MADKQLESLDLDISKALSSLDKLDKRLDTTISKIDSLFAASSSSNSKPFKFESTELEKQVKTRQDILDKVNSYNLQLSRGQAIDEQRLVSLRKELVQMVNLGQLYAFISEQARRIGENVGTSSLKFQQLNNLGAQLKSQLDSINNGIKNTATSQLAKDTQALATANARLAAAETEEGAASMQSLQATKEQLITRKLEVQATNEAAGAYSQLVAKYQLAQTAALNHAAAGTLDSVAGKKVAQDAANYATQLSNAANAVNRLGGRAEKGIPAVYSLQQVLLETPNAALGMRTYVVSLSNNLPMLVSQIGMLAKTTAEGSTKALGLGGALRMLVSSLSPATIAMVALSTAAILVVSQWDKVKEAIKGFKEEYIGAIGVLGAYSEQLRTQNGQAQKQYSDVILLGAAIDRYKKNTDGLARSQRNTNGIIELTNKIFGEYAGKVDNINAAMRTYIGNAKEYVEWSINMAVATKQADNIASLTLAKRGLEAELVSVGVGEVDKAQLEQIQLKARTASQVLDLVEGKAGDAKERMKSILVQWGDAYDTEVTNMQKLVFGSMGDLSTILSTTYQLNPRLKVNVEAGRVTEEQILAMLALREQIDRLMADSKVNLTASMDDLLVTTKSKRNKAGQQLIDFNRTLLNFDYPKETLEAIKSFYESIANSENVNYDERLKARDTYNNSSKILIMDSYAFELSQATTTYEKIQNEDDNKYLKNKKKLAKNGEDTLSTYQQQNTAILKSISDFKERYVSLDEKAQTEVLANHIAAIKQQISDDQKAATTTTSNEKAYLQARAVNLQNYLGTVTKSSLDLNTQLQDLTISVINMTSAIETDKLKLFLDKLNAFYDNKKSVDSIKEVEEAIGRLQTRLSNGVELDNSIFGAGYQKEIDERLAKQKSQLRESQDLVEKTKREMDAISETLSKKFTDKSEGVNIAKKLGIDKEVLSQLDELNTKFISGKLSRQSYDSQSAEIINKYQDNNKKFLLGYKDTIENVSDLDKQLSDKAIENNLALSDKIKTGKDILAENLAEIEDILSKTLTDVSNGILDINKQTLESLSQLSETTLSNYLLDLDKLQKADDKAKEIKLKALEVDGLTTEEQEANAKKKDEIEAWYASQKEAREAEKERAERETKRKQRDIEIIQATADMLVTIAEIKLRQMEYAAKIAAAYPEAAPISLGKSFALFGIMEGLAASSGAMKIALLSAQKFAEGGEVKKDMLAWVGDAYKHEFGVTKEGKVFMTPNEPTLVPLAKDTVIYKDHETFLKDYINPNMNTSLIRGKELSYKRELSGLIKIAKGIEANTRFNPNLTTKYYEYLR